MSDKEKYYSGCNYIVKNGLDENDNQIYCCSFMSIVKGKFNCNCTDYTDCYYKQLQASQQECEKLKQQNSWLAKDKQDLIEKVEEINNCFEINILQQENTALKQQLDTAIEELEKISEFNCKQCIDYEVDEEGEQCFCEMCCCSQLSNIAKTALDKIKEKE